MGDRRYTYRAEWSHEDDEYVGLVAEFPSLSWLAPTAAEAIAGIEELVDEVVEDLVASGDPVPVALAERRYGGKIALRISPDLHRRLTIGAAEQQLSLNQWIGQLLSEGSVASATLSAAVEGALADVMRAVVAAVDECSEMATKMAEMTQRLISSRAHALPRLSPYSYVFSSLGQYEPGIATAAQAITTGGILDSARCSSVQSGLQSGIGSEGRDDDLLVREHGVDYWPQEAQLLVQDLRDTFAPRRDEGASTPEAGSFYSR